MRKLFFYFSDENELLKFSEKLSSLGVYHSINRLRICVLKKDSIKEFEKYIYA